MKSHTEQQILAGMIFSRGMVKPSFRATADRIKEALVIQSLRIAGAFLLSKIHGVELLVHGAHRLRGWIKVLMINPNGEQGASAP
jgi:hypothetical protein